MKVRVKINNGDPHTPYVELERVGSWVSNDVGELIVREEGPLGAELARFGSGKWFYLERLDG